MARALLFHSKLLLSFGEKVSATHIINRLPSKVLGGKSPLEVLFGKTPTYNHLRVFGCLCFAKNPIPKHKFDTRAYKFVFVGYPLGRKLISYSI